MPSSSSRRQPDRKTSDLPHDRVEALIRAGVKSEARHLLEYHLRANPADPRGWWLLAQVMPTVRQQLWCVEQVLRYEPLNSEARARKAYLQRQVQRLPAPRVSRSATSRSADVGYLPLAILFMFLCVMGVMTLMLLFLEYRNTDVAIAASDTPGLVLELPTNTATPDDPIPSATYTPEEILPTPTPTPLPDVRQPPEEWREWKVIPSMSQRALEVYRAGIARGNDPHQFTILGDFHSVPDAMFGQFDDPAFLLPAEHAGLQAAREHFAGQFSRQPVTVQYGMDEAKLFSVLWNDINRCDYDEPPLECELRIHNPSIAIISLGTNWGASGDEKFETYMRRILDRLLEEDILPIITTVADTEAGDDFPLNRIMAELSYEYDLPLWNFWRVAQAFPNGGLVTEPKEKYHLTHEALDARRYSGLAVLDAILQATR